MVDIKRLNPAVIAIFQSASLLLFVSAVIQILSIIDPFLLVFLMGSPIVLVIISLACLTLSAIIVSVIVFAIPIFVYHKTKIYKKPIKIILLTILLSIIEFALFISIRS